MALSTFSFPCHLVESVASDPQKPITQSFTSSLVGAAALYYPSQRVLKVVKRPCVCASLSQSGEYHSQRPPTPLLDTINYPIHMKNLSTKELKQLAEELRSDVIFNVSKTGGHLGSSLGVVELTVAIHYVFNTPQDKILWDVGHQSYPHKILTGRRDMMPTLRQTNGLSGFTKRSESEYDCFGTGHSSTRMAVGRDLKGRKNNVIAVIGDGAMTAGQAYEAMNNAGYLDSDMIVILNDNKQVSLPTATLDGPIPPVGALSSALSRLQSSRPLRELREVAKVIHDVDLQKLPVRFALDRAGLVGADGPTHSGSFDVTYMACLPNMVVMAPSDEAELFHMVATAAAIDDRPSCFRYPRGNGIGVPLPPGNKGIPLEVGKGRILIEGQRVALLGYGAAVQSCLAAASLVENHGLKLTVADARFCKPLDQALVRSLVKSHEVLITVEEGSIGGFGSHVAQFLALNGLLDGTVKWRPLVLPDQYIDHGAPADQMEAAGLTPSHIAATVFNILGQTRDALEIMSQGTR
ncbi:hypothetical protein QJS10_CPB17g01484 [Acorus calamus]|uniref:1-deoxy-D-xylulose-5-phosphate synthase n=1 Tax=Acorus calamus TaxID=4465 RepID=A0AAV9CT86_ACOCL|nr:hypothetical protein QJS10_CPB17g01484 [Acorus calamus]